MKVFHKMTSKGPVTTATYVGPCGFPCAASFVGTLSPPEVERQLKINRALDAQQKKVAS